MNTPRFWTFYGTPSKDVTDRYPYMVRLEYESPWPKRKGIVEWLETETHQPILVIHYGKEIVVYFLDHNDSILFILKWGRSN